MQWDLVLQICAAAWQGSSNRKSLAWDAPQTLCEVFPMPIYTSGLLEAKPNSPLGFILLTLSSSEPCQLLYHCLPPARADLASLLLQGPQSHCHVAANISAMQSRKHNMFQAKLPIGFRTPDKPTECRAASPHSANTLSVWSLVPFFFPPGLVSMLWSLNWLSAGLDQHQRPCRQRTITVAGGTRGAQQQPSSR